jgi:hypothetical protein
MHIALDTRNTSVNALFTVAFSRVRRAALESFDDGSCVEGNGSPKALERGNVNNSAFTLPTEGISANSSYTVYLVWNFSGSGDRDKTDQIEVRRPPKYNTPSNSRHPVLHILYGYRPFGIRSGFFCK